jgi:histidinol-phosphatase (PHP family)
MDASCAAALRMGIPAVAFTEHLDFTPFRAGHLSHEFGALVDKAGILTAPPFDVEGYLENIALCRRKYPELRILTGLEVGQPHRHGAELARVLNAGGFERVLGSLHCLPDGADFAEPFELFRKYPAEDVLRAYLAEVPAMVTGSDQFEVFAHIDYPARTWPDEAAPFAAHRFEPEFRDALGAIAAADLVLEVSAKRPLEPVILGWWVEEGGRRVTFASDGHLPATIGLGLDLIAAMAESYGFRPSSRPEDPWIRQ